MNITERTHQAIRQDPSIVDCLNRGLLNHSALARSICRELGVDAFDAVLMACRRFPKESVKGPLQRDRQVAAMIRSAKLVLRSKMVVATIDKPETFQRALTLQQLVKKRKGDFKLIEGEETLTLITNEEYLTTIRELFDRSVINLGTDLVQISMVFSEQIVTTIGVCAYLYRLFADNGINLREEMSCWTDVMMLIDEQDMAKAIQLLSR